jgi:hypothetical protein
VRCLCCSEPAAIGGLCKACATDVPPPVGLIADHVRSTVAPDDAIAWLVDGFGNAHALAPLANVGRATDGAIVVLASSVSREHAELRKLDDGWAVRDLGSRNGTFVDGVRCQGRAALPERAVVKVGDVPLWFLAQVHDDVDPASSFETVSAGGLVRYLMAINAVELCLVGSAAATVGGALLVRAGGGAWKETALAPLEFQLLRMLCERAVDEAKSPAAVRGCVATAKLARALPFQSQHAMDDNVRQLVKRVRQELAAVGVEGLVAVAPGRGYYIACQVTAGGPER